MKVEGIFKATERGFGFVQVNEEEKNYEVFIAERYKNTAMDGDKVLVNITKKNEFCEERKKEGKIENIIKRNKIQVVGTYIKNQNFGFVIPDDNKITEDIFISKKKALKAKNKDKVVVKYLKYQDVEKRKKAEGEIIEIIGNINDAEVDMLSIIKELKLLNEFPKFVLDEANNISEDVIVTKNRVDMRDKRVFTIDSEDAKDLDDGVMVTKTEQGTYILDVHIADVSHYVKEKSLINKEALERGTSIYMLDRVIPMLPTKLSNGICSLNQGQDRYTLSCTMEINKDGIVVSSKIYKAVINVTERMTYTNVFDIISNPKCVKDNLSKYKSYVQDFLCMEELAKILKNRRLKDGYIDFDLPEIKIILDKKGRAVDIKKYETNFANEIVEQFMLTANETVAKTFYDLEAPFIYRVHETPDYDKIVETNNALKSKCILIKAKKDEISPECFAKVLANVKNTENKRVVSNFMLRALKLARYENKNLGHFGIASNYYCHFTSPIRRYPDLFIHRVISKYIERGYKLEKEDIEKIKKEAEEFARKNSESEKQAVKAERLSKQIKMCEYMEKYIGKQYIGIVSSITSFGMFVELDNLCEGLIPIFSLPDYYEFDNNRKILVGKTTGNIFSIGDKIKIKVSSANKISRKIDFEFVSENRNNIERKIKNRSKKCKKKRGEIKRNKTYKY